MTLDKWNPRIKTSDGPQPSDIYRREVVRAVEDAMLSYGSIRAFDDATQANLLLDILGMLSYVVPIKNMIGSAIPDENGRWRPGRYWVKEEARLKTACPIEDVKGRKVWLNSLTRAMIHSDILSHVSTFAGSSVETLGLSGVVHIGENGENPLVVAGEEFHRIIKMVDGQWNKNDLVVAEVRVLGDT